MFREDPSCAKFHFDKCTTTGALLTSDYNVNNYRLRRTVPGPSSTFSEDHAGILDSFRWFYDENIVLVPPVRGFVEVSRGVEL